MLADIVAGLSVLERLAVTGCDKVTALVLTPTGWLTHLRLGLRQLRSLTFVPKDVAPTSEDVALMRMGSGRASGSTIDTAAGAVAESESTATRVPIDRAHVVHTLVLEDVKLQPGGPGGWEAALQSLDGSLAHLTLCGVIQGPELTVWLPNLRTLAVERLLRLQTLQVRCPRLDGVRVIGCPRLHALETAVDNFDAVTLMQSEPMVTVKRLTLTTNRPPRPQALALAAPGRAAPTHWQGAASPCV
jgi:hypothetical protein